jgi:hypothetical protein
MFPSNGCLKRHPLGSTGSFGRVPPLHGYSGTLRLPAARLAALRCLRLAIPPLRPIRSHRPGRATEGTGSWYSGSRAGHVGGNGRVSQVPERPSCPCALLFDPGRTEARQALAARRRGPRVGQRRWLPPMKISGLDHTASGLAVCASQWRSPPGSREVLLPPRPLRTGRESFPSSSSSIHERPLRDAAVSAFRSWTWICR